MSSRNEGEHSAASESLSGVFPADNASPATAMATPQVFNRKRRALHSLQLSMMLGASRLLPHSLTFAGVTLVCQGIPSTLDNTC